MIRRSLHQIVSIKKTFHDFSEVSCWRGGRNSFYKPTEIAALGTSKKKIIGDIWGPHILLLEIIFPWICICFNSNTLLLWFLLPFLFQYDFANLFLFQHYIDVILLPFLYFCDFVVFSYFNTILLPFLFWILYLCDFVAFSYFNTILLPFLIWI